MRFFFPVHHIETFCAVITGGYTRDFYDANYFNVTITLVRKETLSVSWQIGPSLPGGGQSSASPEESHSKRYGRNRTSQIHSNKHFVFSFLRQVHDLAVNAFTCNNIRKQKSFQELINITQYQKTKRQQKNKLLRNRSWLASSMQAIPFRQNSSKIISQQSILSRIYYNCSTRNHVNVE